MNKLKKSKTKNCLVHNTMQWNYCIVSLIKRYSGKRHLFVAMELFTPPLDITLESVNKRDGSH